MSVATIMPQPTNLGDLIDRTRDRSAENSRAVTYVTDFAQIADCLLGAARPESL